MGTTEEWTNVDAARRETRVVRRAIVVGARRLGNPIVSEA